MNTLVLENKDGKIINLTPQKFDYYIEHRQKPLYDEDGYFCGYETDYFNNIDIEQFNKIFTNSSFLDPATITEIHCKGENAEELFEIIQRINKAHYSNKQLLSINKNDVMLQGKMCITDDNSKLRKYTLRNCQPSCYIDDVENVGIITDFIIYDFEEYVKPQAEKLTGIE